jgi:predicted helicase
MEVIAITDSVPKPSKKSAKAAGTDAASQATAAAKAGSKGAFTIGTPGEGGAPHVQASLQFEVGELERALYARVVKKCGNRNHWEDWANDIAKIANTHIARITAIVSEPQNTAEVAAFQSFANELRDDLNDSITDAEVIEMLAQHLITKPVFDALFEDYSFASNNPVSMAMQGVLDVLQEHHLEKEADTLEQFYASVRRRADQIDDVTAKQKIVVELYDKFFRNAFPKMTERLGIVYTPVEVVDFIIHSVNDLLQQEFGQTLGSKGVHIIDPFTGTGTFITRLLQSGLISEDQLPHKYQHEIHANEIVLLAYYIAAINIEAVYHGVVGGKYQPFEGICLTDTFRMGEEDLVSELMEGNSTRRKRQQKLDVRVIMGNPPYSVGQENANDNNQNVSYPELDARIRETYVADTSGTSIKNNYDSYIRAIRWASDRIGDHGIIGFVSGSAWIERSFAQGLRKCLADEFSSLYIIHLRGDIRKNMLSKGAAKEGGNVFDSGSMTGIAIYFLIKNLQASEHGQIYFHDIGNDLTGARKREILAEWQSAQALTKDQKWRMLSPDLHHDWLNQRDTHFETFPILGDKKNKSAFTLFDNYSLGANTNRDTWIYNFSPKELSRNMQRMIETYNSELAKNIPQKEATHDPKSIKWSSSLVAHFERKREATFQEKFLIKGLYRPFTRQWLYFDPMFIHRVGQLPQIFPNSTTENLVISVSGVGARAGFSSIISSSTTDLETVEKSQSFPLYLYEKEEAREGELFSGGGGESTYTRRDAITDGGLAHFREKYPAAGEGDSITKEDLFYYIYGLLHSPDYRSRYADNLSKELPRIPAVKTYAAFRAYAQAGRDLAHWHLNYETVECDPGVAVEEAPAAGSATGDRRYRVTKMKFGKRKCPDTGKNIADKTTVIYNDFITLRNIPLEAYDYIVNGKPALEWVMERQCVKEDPDSGITNDANLWATETMHNPKYPLELFLRVVTVSLETNRIVAGLPGLEIENAPS